jgi:hypothetical protein
MYMQTSSDGMQSEIWGATTGSYMLSVDDIGFFVSVSCEPVRSDWARGPIVLSEQIGPIIPGRKLISSFNIYFQSALFSENWFLFFHYVRLTVIKPESSH